MYKLTGRLGFFAADVKPVARTTQISANRTFITAVMYNKMLNNKLLGLPCDALHRHVFRSTNRYGCSSLYWSYR